MIEVNDVDKVIELDRTIKDVLSIWYDQAIPALKEIPGTERVLMAMSDPFSRPMKEVDDLTLCPVHGNAMQKPLFKLQRIMIMIDVMLKILVEQLETIGKDAAYVIHINLAKMMEVISKNTMVKAVNERLNESTQTQDQARDLVPVESAVAEKNSVFFSRFGYQRQFFKTHGMTQDVHNLIAWIKDFYCNQYLKRNERNADKQAKATQILEHLQNHPPQAGDTVQSFMTRGNPTLAQLIGQNHLSISTRKIPWGLKQIEKHFGYIINQQDNTRKPKKEKSEPRTFRFGKK